jgi:hypothetical protein
MGCPGIHCACCAGGITVPVVPLAAAFGVAWVVEHLVEVVIVCGTCGVLAVAASVCLFRWADRRDGRRAATWRLLHARVVSKAAVTNSPPGGRFLTAGCDTERPALGFRDVHIHLDGVPAAEQAEVIRRALGA